MEVSFPEEACWGNGGKIRAYILEKQLKI